jgi:hypothetical protein
MTIEEQLRTAGKLVYTNRGVSMLPLLRENRDVMVIEACKANEIKKLDAVLFVRHRKEKKDYVLHRVLRQNADGSFWIVGDHCVQGETVPGEQIIGRLSAVVRDGRTISVHDWKYLCYVHLWCDVYPLRFLILRGKAFVRRGLRFLKRQWITKHEDKK